jgi:hypothetical protein
MLLRAALFAGCAAEAQYVVPMARAGTTPQRWEYSCIRADDDDRATRLLNRHGDRGWELVAAAGEGATATGVVWCFKRELP